MKTALSCLSAGILTISLILSSLTAMTAAAEPAETAAGSEAISREDGALPEYRDYAAAHEAVYPGETYTVAGAAGANAQNAAVSHDGRADAVRFDGGSLSYTVSVRTAGYYRLRMEYEALPGKGKELEIAVQLNGAVPFDKAASLTFNRLWKNGTDGAFEHDSRGNDVLPDQTEVQTWIARDAADAEGLYADPFLFWLEAGDNTVTLQNLGEPFVLGSLCFHPTAQAKSYAELRPAVKADNVTGFMQLLEGEHADRKSHNTIIPTYNRGDPALSPADPTVIRRNTIGGGTSWQSPGEYVTWRFTVPQDGYYKIGIKYAQSQQRGLSSSRRVYIDGETIFRELEEVSFGYTSTFQNQVLGGGDEEILFYFTAGETHELTLETTVGAVAEDLRVLSAIQTRLNEMYRKIIMVTGAEPDVTRDYDLEAEIPDILSVFSTVADTLEDEYQRFSAASQKSGSEAETLREFAEKLREFIQKPYTIAERLSSYRDSLSSLATWLMARKQQPLEIDYVAVFSPDQTMPGAESSFFAKLAYEWKGFLSSFTQDYNAIGADADKEPVEVWIASGREQSLIVRELTDARFFRETGIPVTVRLVKAGLVQCVMAGVGPDVAIGVERTLPVNLAMRSALVDLSRFDGYDAVTERFAKTAMEPYLFNGGAYALPDTQSFHMMFYRTDIFKELNIGPPDTWDDFYRVINIVQRNNMEIGLPYGVSTSTADAMSLFPTLLLQKGGTYYNADKSASVLCSTEGFSAFSQWTDFYTQYSFSMVKDDYNRFRTGEMPLTVMPYVFYNQLRVAAPEITGLWEMTCIPGTKRADGTVDRSEAAAGTANVMFRGAESPENAWAFLEWWTRADTQAAYGVKIETVLGAAGRYASANLEAVTQLPWTQQELAAIGEQRQYVTELPEVAGGYYMARNINNAFLAVVNRGENLRESLRYWDNETNREIARKRRELGLAGDTGAAADQR